MRAKSSKQRCPTLCLTAIPSSATVERLFPIGSDILRSKRSSMTKGNFEKFVLLHENVKCLKKSTHYF